MKKKVIVIGAGIAGLAGGYALMKNGFSVTIFEKNSRVGGRMRTESVEGRFTIDTGAQDLHDRRAAPNTFRLIDELGMKDKVVPFAFTSAMVRNGIVHKMPRQKLTAAFRFSGLSLACQARILKMVQSLARHHRKLDREKPENWVTLDTETIEQYMLREFNEELLDYFVNPLIRPLAMADPNNLSLIYLFLVLKLEFFCRHHTLKEGIGSLPAKIAEKCSVRLNHTVKKFSGRTA